MAILNDLVLSFVTGFGIALLIELIVDLLGENIRFRITFLERRASKWISNYSVSLNVSLKPLSWTGGKFDKVRALLEETLDNDDIEHFENGTKVSFPWIEKKISIPVTCSFTADEGGNNDGLDVIIDYPMTYQGFGDHFVNLLTTISAIERLLRATFHEVTDFQATLSLKGLKRSVGTTGIFASHGVEAITTKKDGFEIDFSRDTVVLYGKLNSDMRRLVQDIVTYYG